MPRTIPHAVLPALMLAAAGGACHAQTLLIDNAMLVDVEAGQTRGPLDILISDGSVARIGERVEAPSDAIIIDGTGLYIIPGLIDSHVHCVDPASFGRLMLAHGVLACRDNGSETTQILATRDQLNAGGIPGPRMIATGAIVDGNPPVWPFSIACETPDQGRQAVRDLHDAGVDQIKVYARLLPEVYAAVVDEATALGLTVTGHVPTRVPLGDAIQSGQDCIEHLDGIGLMMLQAAPEEIRRNFRGQWAGMSAWALYPDVVSEQATQPIVDMIAESGVAQCPTVVVTRSMGRLDDDDIEQHSQTPFIPGFMRAFWDSGQYRQAAPYMEALVAPMARFTARLHRAGVPILVGTDLANPYVFAGYSVHEEMWILEEEGGMEPADVLRAATSVPAAFHGWDDLGTIAVGKAAELVLLGANPLETSRNAMDIRGIIHRGEYLDRDALDTLLAEAKAAARGEPLDPEPVAASGSDLPPGETILRAEYAMKFGQWDAGSEVVTIRRDPTTDSTSVSLHVVCKPAGGPIPPATVVLRFSPTGGFEGATWAPTAGGASGTYWLEADELVASGGPLEGDPTIQRHPIETPFLANCSSFAAVAAQLPSFRIEPGASTTAKALSFGMPSWEVSPGSVVIERKPNATLDQLGASREAQVYVVSDESGAGSVTYSVTAAGVLLRVEMRFAGGSLSLEPRLLEEPGGRP